MSKHSPRKKERPLIKLMQLSQLYVEAQLVINASLTKFTFPNAPSVSNEAFEFVSGGSGLEGSKDSQNIWQIVLLYKDDS